MTRKPTFSVYACCHNCINSARWLPYHMYGRRLSYPPPQPTPLRPQEERGLGMGYAPCPEWNVASREKEVGKRVFSPSQPTMGSERASWAAELPTPAGSGTEPGISMLFKRHKMPPSRWDVSNMGDRMHTGLFAEFMGGGGVPVWPPLGSKYARCSHHTVLFIHLELSSPSNATIVQVKNNPISDAYRYRPQSGTHRTVPLIPIDISCECRCSLPFLSNYRTFVRVTFNV